MSVAAGMPAVFAAPLASLGLAVELVPFAFKSRRLFPVSPVAGIVVATLRRPMLGDKRSDPPFPKPPRDARAGDSLGPLL